MARQPASPGAVSRFTVPLERLADILDIAEDGIITVNADQEIVLFNRGAAKIFSFTPAEALGQPLDLVIPTRFHQAHRGYMAEFARSGTVSRLMGERRSVFGRRKDGTEFPAEISISKLEGHGRPLFTAIVRDITERKVHEEAILRLNQDLEERVKARTEELVGRNLDQARTEAELRAMTQQLWQAARLAAVGELAASIAHELNNPLGTVSLRIEGILAKTPTDDPRRHALEVVDQEVSRMAALVGNLLQFSRAGREQISTVNVCDEIVKTIELTDYHLKRRGVKIEPDLHRETPHIYADRQQLRQVFLNLFTNAGDAMPQGGRLVPRVQPGELRGEPAICVEVVDTGVGIAPELLPRVLDPFFTTKAEGKGTGLGLAICRRIVEQHHGVLQLESKIGQGTTVRVILPVRSSSNLKGLHSA
jgi:PAS domain S-box-containing protein